MIDGTGRARLLASGLVVSGRPPDHIVRMPTGDGIRTAAVTNAR